MGTTQVSSRVDAEPQAVFATLTDPSRLPSWNAVIRRVVDAPATLTEGAEWVVELHVLGRTWNSRSKVVELDAATGTFRYRTQTDDGNPSYVDWSWTVVPAGHGGSDVTVGWDIHPLTFWRRVLFAHVRRSQLRREVATSLTSLANAARTMVARG